MTKNWKLSIYLIVGFILFTPIGTVTHELGHYTFAKLIGYEASINYGKTFWKDNTDLRKFDSIYAKYETEITNGTDYPAKQEFDSMLNRSSRDSFLISLGGPLQTVLTGTIGLLILLFSRQTFYSSEKLNFKQWIIIFVSLFWLRQVFNFVHGVLVYFTKGYFPGKNDEVRMAVELGINKLSITLPTAVIASCILAFVVFKVIPVKQRLTFMISGIIGGSLGFYLWLHLLGPILMP